MLVSRINHIMFMNIHYNSHMFRNILQSSFESSRKFKNILSKKFCVLEGARLQEKLFLEISYELVPHL